MCICTDTGSTDRSGTWPTMEIAQLTDISITDALRMSLKCTATVGKNNLARYDMKWSGVHSEHSLWIQQSHITKKGDNIERSLTFKPWLDLLAGEYTCHLVVKNHPSTMMHNKSYVISGMYVMYVVICVLFNEMHASWWIVAMYLVSWNCFCL